MATFLRDTPRQRSFRITYCKGITFRLLRNDWLQRSGLLTASVASLLSASGAARSARRHWRFRPAPPCPGRHLPSRVTPRIPAPPPHLHLNAGITAVHSPPSSHAKVPTSVTYHGPRPSTTVPLWLPRIACALWTYGRRPLLSASVDVVLSGPLRLLILPTPQSFIALSEPHNTHQCIIQHLTIDNCQQPRPR